MTTQELDSIEQDHCANQGDKHARHAETRVARLAWEEQLLGESPN
jgi:hypothetical protein